MLKISIITAILNGSKTLHNCIESVGTQLYSGQCIVSIIIDGGSTDNTLEIINKYEKSEDGNQNLGKNGLRSQRSPTWMVREDSRP